MKYMIISFGFILNFCNAYKLLIIFSFPSRSHSILGEGFVTRLTKAGHDVTYIAPYLITNPPKNLRQIEVTSIQKYNDKMMEKYNVETLLNGTWSTMAALTDLLQYNFVITNGIVTDQNVQNLMLDPKENFDAIIVEWIYSEIYSGFSAVFDCPFIWSSSIEPHGVVLSLIDEMPNPVYTPDFMTAAELPLTFWGRLRESALAVFYKILQILSIVTTVLLDGKNSAVQKLVTAIEKSRIDNKCLLSSSPDHALLPISRQKFARSTASTRKEAYKKVFGPAVEIRGRTLPPYEDVARNASLMFGNSHVSIGSSIRLPQNYKAIGGYHIPDSIPPLPENLKNILDNATNRVVYFSLGSILKSKHLSNILKQQILETFRELKQTIIWKFEEKLTDVPKNVHVLQWAPQLSILSHPNCVLFITHGGLLSVIESLHFGVPIIGIPIVSDQFINVKRAVSKGFGREVTLDYDIASNLKITIQDILGDSRYSERALELSFVYHDRPVTPGEELVHWVEHVVKTRGAPHLRSPALMVPWYQKMHLDVLFFILIVIYIFIKIVKYLLSFCKRRVDLSKKDN